MVSRALIGFIVTDVVYGLAFLAYPFFSLYAFDVIGSMEIGVSLFLRIPGGRLADRYSKRRLILSVIAIDIPVILAFIYAQSFVQVALLFVVWRVIGSLTAGAVDSLRADLTPQAYRGKVRSVTDFLRAAFGFVGSIAVGYLYEVSPARKIMSVVNF